ncbi:MAG: FimV/HubP family polar landmark protein [Marinobacter sp.]|nr:FimV/HubP family polar landmark protein [Marinobacter sp.]
MKVRKLAVALALAGGLGSGVAQALGLGEIELQSYLNEPLEADINLRKSQGIDPDDVFVNIASENDYQRVGIDRNYFLTKLQFEITTSSDGSLIVNVSSREPLREPYLNFLLEVTWPSGRLMREYSVLVDPPVYAEESGIQEQVTAPSTGQISAPESSTRTAPRTDRRAAPQTTGSPRTFGPTGSSDTLWKIAQSVRPNDSVSMQQVMLAIQDLNPNAFMGDNINRLKRGEVLRIPDLEQIQRRSRSEANRLVAVQNDEFSSPTRTVDATDAATPAPAPETGVAVSDSAGGDELRLITADEAGGRDSEEGGSAGGDGQTAGGVDAGSAVAMEELESARRENEELNTRVEDLQDQVETLQRLLELKNSQLADMQQMTGEDDAPVADQEADQEAGERVMEEESMAAGDMTAGQDGAEQPDGDGPEGAGEPDGVEPDAEMVESAADEAVAEDSEAGADEEMVAGDESGMAAQDPSSAAEDGGEPEAETPPSVAPSDTDTAGQPAAPAQQPAKGFPANIIDAITNNTLYQIALGGGLILLLLLLLLLARRSANREKEFYDELNGEEGESDSFDLSLDDEGKGEVAADDPMAEAETYIAYGQEDKAVQTLETAISREPSRTDLRLMLLGVYADAQNRDSFEKQFREIEALEDDSAIREAGALREKLEDAEATPSIDDLESQLRSDSFEQNVESRNDQAESSQPEQPADELEDLDVDFSDLEITDSLDQDSAVEEDKAEAESDSGMVEYDLSGLEESTDDSASDFETREGDEALDFDLEKTDDDTADDLADELSLEDFESLETDFTADDSSEQAKESASFEESSEEKEPEDEGLGDLDESFLDELDAELDKVAGESEDDESLTSEESGLDDLELDVSDEDLALMEEFADSEDTDTPETPELDEELDLEDSLMDKDSETPEELASAEESLEAAEEWEEELPDLGESDETAETSAPEESPAESDMEPPVASDSLDSSARKSAADDINESDLGDDDDFDFLAGTDEAATKLDLARAYIEMGDMDGARDILEEVALEGDDEQKAEAQDLLKNLS